MSENEKNPTALWTSAETSMATGGIPTNFFEAESVSIDSRSIKSYDLFVAIKGEKFDGHDYVKQALENGASAAVVDHKIEGLPKDSPLLVVRDTTKALTDLGTFSRKRSKAKIIAVTGSSGKTSVKDACKLVFSAQGASYATEGNLNNQYGAPLSLSRMRRECQYGVFELGMSGAGELSALSQIVRPHIAIITNVSAAHLEFFDNVEAIADAKSEICAGLEQKGTLILNHDSPFFEYLKRQSRKYDVVNILSFGSHKEADFRLIDHKKTSTGFDITAHCNGRKINYSLQVDGIHHIYNSLAVLAATHAAGADVKQAAKTLSQFEESSGRGNRKKIALGSGSFDVIDDSYNANPSSVAAALKTLGQFNDNGRTIAILGDMKELGENSKSLHRALAQSVEDNNIDLVFTIGEDMQELFSHLPAEKQGKHFADSKSAIATIKDAVKENDTMLVKGSNSLKMNLIVNALEAEKVTT